MISRLWFAVPALRQEAGQDLSSDSVHGSFTLIIPLLIPIREPRTFDPLPWGIPEGEAPLALTLFPDDTCISKILIQVTLEIADKQPQSRKAVERPRSSHTSLSSSFSQESPKQ